MSSEHTDIIAPHIAILVVIDHSRMFLAAAIWYVAGCFTNFAFLSNTCLYSSHGIIKLIAKYLSTLVSRRESLRIVFVLPICAIPHTFSVIYVCILRAVLWYLHAKLNVSWSMIGNSSFPHFHLNSTVFSSSLIHTTTAYLSTFTTTLHFLAHHFIPFSIRSCDPSGVFDIPIEGGGQGFHVV